jgi:hypothetical protein
LLKLIFINPAVTGCAYSWQKYSKYNFDKWFLRADFDQVIFFYDKDVAGTNQSTAFNKIRNYDNRRADYCQP